MHACLGKCMEVRGKLEGVNSFLLLGVDWG